MADYLITFARSARKELEALSNALVNRIVARIQVLGRFPRRQVAKNFKAPGIFGAFVLGTIE